MTNPLLLAPLPETTLDAGCTVTFEALDPTTGATVTGVVVSNVALYGLNDTADAASTLPDAPAPLYTVEDLEMAG